MNPQRIANAAKTNAESFAENIWLRFVARLSMVMASTVILPIGVFLFHRTLNNIDEMQRAINAMTTQIVELRVTLNVISNELDKQGQQQTARDARQDFDRQRIEGRLERLEK